MNRKSIIKTPKRIVIKVGTSLLAKTDKSLNKAFIRAISKQICALVDQHKEIVLVSSGAIGAGMGVLGFKRRPKRLPDLQACAAVGQHALMQAYDQLFQKHGYHTAQILLTRDGLTERGRYLNARNTLQALLHRKIIPVINENDTVSVDEIKFGDNDRLSALVSNVVDADLLIILSDVAGLLADGAGGKSSSRISCVKEFSDEIISCAGTSISEATVGGMVTKIQAATIVIASGIPMIIADGEDKNILAALVAGDDKGTLFIPKDGTLTHRKRWLAFTSHSKGIIQVDNGAQKALCERGTSLLASGITTCSGHFQSGDCVSVVTARGKEFARGLTNYTQTELEKIKGCKTGDITRVLGYKCYDEVIHRDNLVLL